MHLAHPFILSLLPLLPFTTAQTSLYKPCPLLGPYFPAPRIDPNSPALKSTFNAFTSYIDSYLAAGTGDFGPITPNTTSFSLSLFAGGNLVRNGNGSDPLFYEYHHGAGVEKPDRGSVYAAGDLTQILTVLASLVELGVEGWERSIVEFLPELEGLSTGGPLRAVQWRNVTLGALAGHMAGIVRHSDACRIDGRCQKDIFLKKLASKPPVYLPDTTPIYSRAAFQLLAFALEAKCGQPFAQILQDRILAKLNLSSTSLLKNTSAPPFGHGLSNSSTLGEPASLSLLTSTADLATFGHSFLTSSLLPQSTTRRWLKPFTSTSNIANSVGRPWEIYHYRDNATGTIIDVYTKTGTVGRYSNYFGLAPDYGVGFSILALNSEGEAPDLNAYADMALFALLQLQSLAEKEAQATYPGTYTSAGNASSIVLNITDSGSDPGLAVTHLVVNGTDWLATIAEQSGILDPANLDFRLYPTNLVEGGKRVWQGVIQDKSALADFGTPTCISWQTVGELERGGLALDAFVIEVDDSGEARTVVSDALGVRFQR
ncbi:hypothetical protein M409DRAFT_64310 [Zasmidium cellare ATCC 36951]|uniref:Uncharacterized protein n=1 Tax=Zasmidium cellare ATCC 36951 TaxID=1080233 RepID=A0A6A6CUE1_ZASCE|nr:uncharacterized protein M409DRAFT_64310 [Zasmidium cellare ATCC 36951]KAF2170655.1 hypothetical protein M409DRAFT_64310 [Zasmidium cellare ATCC 36951]